MVLSHGIQCLDRRWSTLMKKYFLKELASKHSGKQDLNQKIGDYIKSFVWRCNVPNDAQLEQLGILGKTCK